MISKGRFRHIRSMYRCLESKCRFNELYGDPVGITVTHYSNLVLDPIEPDKLLRVHSFESDVSKCIADVVGLPLHFITTEKGPANNVTYL